MDTSKDISGFSQVCDRVSFRIERLSTWAAGALFLVNVADICMSVFARYLFSFSPVWTEELARYTVIWMVMLAANAALRRGEHMAIDILLKYFPFKFNVFLVWVRRAIFIGSIGFMTWMGYKYAIKVSPFTTMGLGITKTIPMLAIPVGMTLLFIQYLLLQFIPDKREQPPIQSQRF
jgi:TRAP-type C4-dicarboxylate transport system permease small subunit